MESMNYMPGARNVPATPPPADIPVAPVPPIVGQPEPGPGTDQIPVPPIAPPGQPPVAGPDNIPETPIAPPGQPPAAPGPVIPVPRVSTVRFLDAVTDGEPLRIVVGSRLVANSLEYGGMTGYYSFIPGFRTVTIYSARQPWVVLFQSSVPLNTSEVITLAVVRAGGVLDLVRISDAPCSNRPRNRACIRTVNLVYNSPALDVMLSDGRVVFTDVRYKEVTTYRQARPQTYDFYIAQTPYTLAPAYTDIQTVEDMPMILPNYYLPGYGSVEPLVSFYIDAKAGTDYTIYVLGNWDFSHIIRTKVVENL